MLFNFTSTAAFISTSPSQHQCKVREQCSSTAVSRVPLCLRYTTVGVAGLTRCGSSRCGSRVQALAICKRMSFALGASVVRQWKQSWPAADISIQLKGQSHVYDADVVMRLTRESRNSYDILLAHNRYPIMCDADACSLETRNWYPGTRYRQNKWKVILQIHVMAIRPRRISRATQGHRPDTRTVPIFR
jgi:hypothetical protein